MWNQGGEPPFVLSGGARGTCSKAGWGATPDSAFESLRVYIEALLNYNTNSYKLHFQRYLEIYDICARTEWSINKKKHIPR